MIKTKKQVIKENPNYKTLINAVINGVGLDAVQDITNHGISGGFHGFIYYYDTHRFAIKHRKSIIKLLEEQADICGYSDVVEMIKSIPFNKQFNRSPMDKEDLKKLYSYLGKGKCEHGSITNLMAWFAAEEVCKLFIN